MKLKFRTKQGRIIEPSSMAEARRLEAQGLEPVPPWRKQETLAQKLLRQEAMWREHVKRGGD